MERSSSRRPAGAGAGPARPRGAVRVRRALGWLLAAWLSTYGAATAQEPPPAEPAPAPQAAPAREQPPQEPAPGDVSFDELLAAEEAAAAADAEALARSRSRLPFELRSQPLEGLPAGMAALILGSRPGGQVVSSVLALPLGRAVEPAPPPPPPPIDEEAAAAEAAGEEGGTAAEAPPAPPADPGPPRELVALVVEIDGSTLLGPNPGERAEVEVFAYALAGNGGVRGFLSQRLPLDLADYGEALYAGGVKMVGHLALPPGEYVLRVLVHEASSQRFGLRAVPLTVPAGSAVSPPLAAEPAAGAESPWLLVLESPHGLFGRVDFGELLHRAGTPLPSALPVLPGDEAEIDLLITRGAAAPESFEARLLDVEGEPAATLAAPVLARSGTDLAGFDRLRLRLPLDELAVGSYFLTLAGVVDGREAISPELPLVVTRDTGGALVWTDVERRLSGGAASAELALGGQEEGGRRRGGARNERAERAVAAAYRAVLDR
ncbi:MAG TPA: hypothetical protein VHM02_13030, partial [Thermoanaerobaculia bacterium]|nr:hypothetical protein [Thermoanaerobaculia bacterium]